MVDVTKTLQEALLTLESHRARIDTQIAGVEQALGTRDGHRMSGRRAATATTRRKRRSMTAAARKAVSVRMKAYWAKRREMAKKKVSKKK